MIIGLNLSDWSLVSKYEKGNTYFQYTKSLPCTCLCQFVIDQPLSCLCPTNGGSLGEMEGASGKWIHIAYIHHVFNIFVNSNYCNIPNLDVKEIIVKGNMYKYLPCWCLCQFVIDHLFTCLCQTYGGRIEKWRESRGNEHNFLNPAWYVEPPKNIEMLHVKHIRI